MAILDHRQPPRLRLARRRPADQNGEEDEGQDGPGDDKDDWQVHGQLVSASIAGGRDGALKTRPHAACFAPFLAKPSLPSSEPPDLPFAAAPGTSSATSEERRVGKERATTCRSRC